MKWPKLRVYLPLVILVLFGLYTNLRIVNKEADRLHGPGRFEEAVYDARLAPLKAVLPPDAIVGYVTDEEGDVRHRVKYFYLTQYDLCPVLVVRGKSYPYVIGGYYDIDNPRRTDAADLLLVRDFGAGIELYRRRQQ